ncbi:hypothetical protein ACFWSF_36000 [Streptomyces sp. NPDC058611]
MEPNRRWLSACRRSAAGFAEAMASEDDGGLPHAGDATVPLSLHPAV